MQNKNKRHGRWLLALVILTLSVFCFSFIAGAVGEDNTATTGTTAPNSGETFSVDMDGEVKTYDLTTGDDAEQADPDYSGAYTYADDYADVHQYDPDHSEHITQAVDTIRGDVPHYATFWSLLPPLLAIVLALITKEVYSSLFIGILAGGLIYSNFNLETTMTHVFSDGFVGSVADSYNAGILLFLVLLGALVAMMNKAGGSAAFGRWAAGHIKSRVGAQLATIAMGVLIFIDDYFNCLTVGSVMRPVTDKQNISRAKLAYLIDATAAPVCIIAPISSWAAAVAGFAAGAGADSGMSLFVSAIPFNFYALLTIAAMIIFAVFKFDFGPM